MKPVLRLLLTANLAAWNSVTVRISTLFSCTIATGTAQQTNGKKTLENAVFYARFAQKVIHTLTTFTPAGRLYETDTRLRPSGASGLLVSSLNAFRTYQQDKAWVWEHQALLRARVITGSAEFAGAI